MKHDTKKVIEDLLRVIEDLMPGVRHLALQDYAILNDAPLAAREHLAEMESAAK